MQSSDPFVRALIALCKREGGHRNVAEVARVSPENLWQIINFTKLPSGNPRGVGPSVRRKLDEAYPDWMSSTAGSPSTSSEPEPTEDVQPMPTIGATILQLGALLATLSPMGQKTIAALVEEVLKDPSKAREAAETADAIARTQRMPVRDESISRSFGRAQESPVETGLTPLE